jgi:hypothetical protein
MESIPSMRDRTSGLGLGVAVVYFEGGTIVVVFEISLSHVKTFHYPP